MKVTLTLVNAAGEENLCKGDLDENIASLKRVIDGTQLRLDFISLSDTLTILNAIRRELPE